MKVLKYFACAFAKAGYRVVVALLQTAAGAAVGFYISITFTLYSVDLNDNIMSQMPRFITAPVDFLKGR